MKKLMITIVISIVLCFSILILTPITILQIRKNQKHTYILHAGGSLDNLTYLNCQESFSYYYELGFRYFEYDFELSSDGKLIGTHYYNHLEKYNINESTTYEEFKTYKINDKYTPVNEEWLIETLTSYKDVKIILDTKYNEMEIYQRLKNINIDTSNIIPQLYSKEMWETMKNNYNFKEYYFTNYKANYSIEEILEYFNDERITSITIPKGSNFNFLSKANKIRKYKNLYIHTIVNKKEYNGSLLYNCNGFYIDTPIK